MHKVKRLDHFLKEHRSVRIQDGEAAFLTAGIDGGERPARHH